MFKSPCVSRPRGRSIEHIPVDAIAQNPAQSRRPLPTCSIQSLIASIRRHGQLSPLLVCATGGGQYELIAGRRRLAALKALGRSTAEAVVVNVSDCESAILALVDNIQRKPLHFLDEAEACRHILDTHPISQERLAAGLSISPFALANRLRLLKLPPSVREAVRTLGLTERHAHALLKLDDAQSQLEWAHCAAERHMSARQLDAHIDHLLRPQPPTPTVTRVVRDNRIIINAVMDTVKELQQIGVNVTGRVDECEDRIDVVVTIPIHHAESPIP